MVFFNRKGCGGEAKGTKGNIYRIPNLKLPILNFESAPGMLLVYSSFTAKVAEVRQRAQSKSNVEHQMMNIDFKIANPELRISTIDAF
jgi:hypothetical protein